MSRARAAADTLPAGLRFRARLALSAVAAGIAGCATTAMSSSASSSSAGPTKGAVSTTNYMASSCAEIADEIKSLEAQVKSSELVLPPYTTGCLDATGQLGSLGVSGASCAIGGPTGIRMVEYAKLRAELDAARDASLRKRCPTAGQ